MKGINLTHDKMEWGWEIWKAAAFQLGAHSSTSNFRHYHMPNFKFSSTPGTCLVTVAGNKWKFPTTDQGLRPSGRLLRTILYLELFVSMSITYQWWWIGHFASWAVRSCWPLTSVTGGGTWSWHCSYPATWNNTGVKWWGWLYMLYLRQPR